jgi:hypothetical protein
LAVFIYWPTSATPSYDGDGYVKAMSTPLPRRVAESVSAKMERDGIRRFEGSLVMPL